MKTLLASSGTKEGIEKLINSYFYSTSYKVSDNLEIINNKGFYSGITIKKRKNRFLAYLT